MYESKLSKVFNRQIKRYKQNILYIIACFLLLFDNDENKNQFFFFKKHHKSADEAKNIKIIYIYIHTHKI
jgi:hypothetical protein